MNSEIRECLEIDGEAVGLSARSLGCSRRLVVSGPLMGMEISEVHDAIVVGGEQHRVEAS